MRTIFRRELRPYSSPPIGYVCVAVLLTLLGLYYTMVMNSRSSSYIASVHGTMFIWCMVIILILTMHSMNEDHRNKTDQALLIAPVGVTGIVMGKSLACMDMPDIALFGSLLPALIISFVPSLSWATVFGTIFGALPYDGAAIPIGMFISSLIQSQTISVIGTFAVSMFLLIVDQLSSSVSNAVIAKLIGWISSSNRYIPFTTGVFNVSDVMFSLSVAAIFLFFTVRRLGSRHWN